MFFARKILVEYSFRGLDVSPRNKSKRSYTVSVIYVKSTLYNSSIWFSLNFIFFLSDEPTKSETAFSMICS